MCEKLRRNSKREKRMFSVYVCVFFVFGRRKRNTAFKFCGYANKFTGVKVAYALENKTFIFIRIVIRNASND